MLTATLCLLVLAQDARPSETRFHRVHLRNGNFVDGDLIKDTEREVMLRLKFGEFVIRRDQVSRIELVKIAGAGEAPKVVTPARKPGPAVKPAAAPPARLAALVHSLKRATGDAKYEILQEIIGLGPEAVDPLVELLAGPDEELRPFIAAALIEKKEPRTLPRVTPLLAHPGAGVRSEAARVVAGLGDRSGAAHVRPLLADPAPRVRESAIAAVEALEGASGLDPAARLLLDPDGTVRNRAIRACFTLSDRHGLAEDLARLLVNALETSRGEATADLLGALGTLGRRDLAPRLLPRLGDDLPRVRAAAVGALANLGAGADEILELLPRERDFRVRAQLALAAQKLKLQRAIDPLIAWLSGGEPEPRELAVRALRALTGQDHGTDAGKWTEWWARTRP